MYSRYHGRLDEGIHVPENYSGCAFAEPERTQPSAPPRQIEVAKPTPTPPPPEPPEVEKRTEEAERETASAHEETRPTAVLSPIGGFLGPLGKHFPFSHGMGFEELLLIGLILLLSQSGVDSEVVLWLALLLFCG